MLGNILFIDVIIDDVVCFVRLGKVKSFILDKRFWKSRDESIGVGCF